MYQDARSLSVFAFASGVSRAYAKPQQSSIPNVATAGWTSCATTLASWDDWLQFGGKLLTPVRSKEPTQHLDFVVRPGWLQVKKEPREILRCMVYH